MLSRHLSIWVESNLVKRKPWPSFFASFRGWIGKQAICCLFFYCCINNNILLWSLSFQYRWYERKTPLAPGPDFLRLSTWSILLKILMGVKGPLTPDSEFSFHKKIIHKYIEAPVDDIKERERSIYSSLHILHGPPNTSPIALYIGWSWKGQKDDLYKCCCLLVVKLKMSREFMFNADAQMKWVASFGYWVSCQFWELAFSSIGKLVEPFALHQLPSVRNILIYIELHTKMIVCKCIRWTNIRWNISKLFSSKSAWVSIKLGNTWRPKYPIKLKYQGSQKNTHNICPRSSLVVGLCVQIYMYAQFSPSKLTEDCKRVQNCPWSLFGSCSRSEPWGQSCGWSQGPSWKIKSKSLSSTNHFCVFG